METVAAVARTDPRLLLPLMAENKHKHNRDDCFSLHGLKVAENEGEFKDGSTLEWVKMSI